MERTTSKYSEVLKIKIEMKSEMFMYNSRKYKRKISQFIEIHID